MHQLSAQNLFFFKESDCMAPLRRQDRGLHASRTAAHHGDFFLLSELRHL